jgi:hypothetical protein
MSRPLSYVGGGTPLPASVFVSAGGQGDLGKWVTAPDTELTDPSAATITSLANTHNALLWAFRDIGFMVVQPRIYFSTAGNTGVKIFPSGEFEGTYAPYGEQSPTSLNLIDVLTQLNALITSACGQLIYDGQRVSLLVQFDRTIQFTDPTTASYDSGLRLMRRLLPVDMASVYTGPAYIQGPLITEPIVGQYDVPAPPTALQLTDYSASSITVSWAASTTAGVSYYVRIAGSSVDKTVTTTNTTYTFTQSADGLAEDVPYTVYVVAATPYEISATIPSVPVFMGAEIPTLPITQVPNTTTTELSVEWTPVIGGYTVVFSSPATVSLAMALGNYTFSGLTPETEYNVTVRLLKFGVFGPPTTVPMTTPVEDLAPTIQSATVLGSNDTQVILAAPFVPSAIATLVFTITKVSDSTITTQSYPYSSTNTYMLVGLLAETTYTVTARYVFTDSDQSNESNSVGFTMWKMFDVYAVSAKTPFLWPQIANSFDPKLVLNMNGGAWPADLNNTSQIKGVTFTAYAERNTGSFIAAAEFLLGAGTGYTNKTMYFSYDNTVLRRGDVPFSQTTRVPIGTCPEIGTDSNWSQPPWVIGVPNASYTITEPTAFAGLFGIEGPAGVYSDTIDKARGIKGYWMISYPAWNITNCVCFEFKIIYSPV